MEPGLRRARHRPARGRPDHPARRRADRRADEGHRSRRSTATGARCATSSWRSGRPTRAGATSTSATSTRRRSTRTSPASGRCLTDADGTYAFTTIKPGPYPWRNHRNAWRPAHIHFSLFGSEFTQRMVTQMYFPGDPLFALDPIYQSIVDQQARDRLVATYDHDVTEHEWATGYRWDIVLTGSPPHPARAGGRVVTPTCPTPGQTVGPFFSFALVHDGGLRAGAGRSPRRRPAHGSGARRRRRPGARRAGGDLAGRPRTAASCGEPGSLHRDGFTFTGWGRAPTDRDRPLHVHHPRARAPRARARRRTSRSPSSPAACSTGCSPGPTCPATPTRWPPTRCSRRSPPERRATLVATADAHGFVFDIRLQGEGETVFLDPSARLTT